MTPALPIAREAFFLQTESGPRFAVSTAPESDSAVRDGWLYLHPFAEEMNKTRRMAAVAAAALASTGRLVLQMDCRGCGDSDGEFGETGWRDWVDDVSVAYSWLRDRCDGPCGIWTIRGGCLLLADWLQDSGEEPDLLLWQPVSNGKHHLTQFLRLRAASEMLGEGNKGIVAQLKTELDAGRPVEVAGYELSPTLAHGLEHASLKLPDAYAGNITVAEIGTGEDCEPSPGTKRLVAGWQSSNVELIAVRGPRFWQTVEIETAPALIDASIPALDRLRT